MIFLSATYTVLRQSSSEALQACTGTKRCKVGYPTGSTSTGAVLQNFRINTHGMQDPDKWKAGFERNPNGQHDPDR